MIGVDAAPLVAAPRRGVARALAYFLRGLPPGARARVRLFAPVALRDESLREAEWADCRTPSAPPRSMRAYRAALPSLVREAGVRVFLSPWSSFPRLPVPVVVTVHEIPFVRWGPIEGRVRASPRLPVALGGLRLPAARGDGVRDAGGRHRLRQAGICLLYTSDAADD